MVAFVLFIMLAGLFASPVASLGPQGSEIRVQGIEAGLAEHRIPDFPEEPEVEKPYSDGPYTIGWTYDSIFLSDKGTSTTARAYYPALAEGLDATSNTTDAPFPLIIFAPGAGQDEDDYGPLGRVAASWGIMFIIVGFNWGITNSGNVADYRDVVDYYIAANASAVHILYQMMDFDRVASGGHSHGARQSVRATPYISEFKVHISLSPSCTQSEVNAIKDDFDVPIQLHTGTTDPLQGHAFLYNTLTVVRETVTVVGGGHAGPFDWSSALSFMFRYLNDDPRYDYWVFKKGIMEEIASENITLKYNRTDGRFFPPILTATSNTTDILEDQGAGLEVAIDGYYDPTFGDEQFCWDFEQDGVPDHCSADPENVTAVYTRASGYMPIVNYSLGPIEIVNDRVPQAISVSNVPPTASIEASATQVEEEARLDFDASASSDTPSDLPGLQFMFDFDDGATRPWSSDPYANHTYSVSNLRVVTVTVKDDDGSIATASVDVNITNLAPIIGPIADREVWEDQTFTLTASGNDTLSDAAGLKFKWDLGDGNETLWNIEPWVEHTYPRSDNYTVTASVRDNDGDTASTTLTVRVRNMVPLATITQPTAGSGFKEDEGVIFSGKGDDNASDLPTLEYSWDFGDGTVSGWAPDPSVSHAYTASGAFDAVLRARDDDMAIGTANMTIRIANVAPTAEIQDTYVPESVEEDEVITLMGSVDDTPSDLEGLTMSWEVESIGMVVPGQNATVSFGKEGFYTIVFKVVDDDGAIATDSVSVAVSNVLPKILDTKILPMDIYVGEEVQFWANASDTPSDMDDLTFTWDMGDGGIFKGSSGNHTYTTAGSYQITLTVQDDDQFGKAERTFKVNVNTRTDPPPPPPPPPPPNGGGGGDDGLSAELMAALAIGIIVVVVLVVAIVLTLGKGKGPGPFPPPQRPSPVPWRPDDDDDDVDLLEGDVSDDVPVEGDMAIPDQDAPPMDEDKM
jgi:PKD repeat protein